MPIYEYRCERGHTFEVMQRMADDPLQTCTTCEAPVQRVFHPVAVHFKGKGFYNTDYGTKRRNREQAQQDSAKSDSKSESKSEVTSAPSKDKGSATSSPAKSDSSAKPSPKKKSD